MKKYMKGFTLVELIVVIAIIGVLAAILVPAMMGWISKANLSTANAGAKEVYQTGQAIYQEIEGSGYEIDGGKTGAISSINGEIRAGGSQQINDDGETFQEAMIRKFADSKSSYWAILFEVNGNPKVLIGTARAAVFSKGGEDSTNYIGTYPVIENNKKGKWANETDEFGAALGEADGVFSDSIAEDEN